jgi:hypothetical protein
VVTSLAGFECLGSFTDSLSHFAGAESVVISLAAFAPRPQRAGPRTLIPAAFRYAPAVSRRTPVACSIRRKDKPSRPYAITCCRLSSQNTLLMAPEATMPLSVVNVPGDYFSMAGFEVFINAGFQVFTEA